LAKSIEAIIGWHQGLWPKVKGQNWHYQEGSKLALPGRVKIGTAWKRQIKYKYLQYER
jgi:hypothetical protein